MSYEEPEPERDMDESSAPSAMSGKAIAALVLGLLSFCPTILLSLLAIVFGILALVDVNRGHGRVRGMGLAITGLVLGSLTLILSPFVGIALLLPAVQKVREAAARTQDANNLKQIGFAFHSYNDAYKTLPPATVYSKDGRPLYSWRVLLLPFMGEDNLYKSFHLDEAWDSPHNMQFAKRMPMEYVSPSFAPDEALQGLTRFQVFVADGSEPGPRPLFVNNPRTLEPFPNVKGATFWTKGAAPSLSQIPDGPAATILVAEAATAVPWTKPADLAYSNRGPLPRLATYSGGTTNVLLANGLVRQIDLRRLGERTLRNAITMDDGQALGPDW